MNYDNPHRLWYEALQRSDTEKWSQKCKDFLLDARGKPWEDWWEAVGMYFEPLKREQRFTVAEVTSEQEAAGWWEDYGWDEDVRLLYVNLLEPDSRLLEDFAKLIQSYRKNKAGRPRFEAMAPDFPFSRIPKIKVINDMLTVWDLKQAGGKTLYEIGVEAGASPNHVIKAGDTKQEQTDKKKMMTITVARMLQRANDLIKGVEQGSFPTY